MVNERTKKKSRYKRLCRWISIPFRRRPSSYIDQMPDVEMKEDSKQPYIDSRMQGNHNSPDNKATFQSHHHEPSKHDYPAKSRYHNERLQHPIVSSYPRHSSATWDEELDRAIARSNNITMRDKLQSPDFEQPQQGRNRRRSMTEKNMDLLVRLHELPSQRISQAPLTRRSLEMAGGRSSRGSHQFDDWISDAPTLPVQCLSKSLHYAVSDDAKMQRSDSRGSERPRRGSRSRDKHDSHQRPLSALSGSTQAATQGPQLRHPANSNIALPRIRPKTVPLRNDPSKVLVHSKSRGFKIVRNLLSLDGMRGEAEEHANEPRHIASLERMADEDRKASQELASQ
jgi:hypothetical protein